MKTCEAEGRMAVNVERLLHAPLYFPYQRGLNPRKLWHDLFLARNQALDDKSVPVGL